MHRLSINPNRRSFIYSGFGGLPSVDKSNPRLYRVYDIFPHSNHFSFNHSWQCRWSKHEQTLLHTYYLMRCLLHAPCFCIGLKVTTAKGSRCFSCYFRLCSAFRVYSCIITTDWKWYPLIDHVSLEPVDTIKRIGNPDSSHSLSIALLTLVAHSILT